MPYEDIKFAAMLSDFFNPTTGAYNSSLTSNFMFMAPDVVFL
jgi:hypothetical protein